MTAAFIVANWAIFTGYVFTALFVAPRVQMRYKITKISAVVFFLTCGLHHAENALHVLFEPDETFEKMAHTFHMLAIDVPQAFAVWGFVIGLYLESVRWGPWRAGYELVDSEDTDSDEWEDIDEDVLTHE